MSLVVPAESTETVQHETDRVERILVVDDDVRLRTLYNASSKTKVSSLKLPMTQHKWIVCYNANYSR